ncbi:transketolase [Klebsiella variicola]|uniref:transketolase n=1 Tax=Klebsiella variicola TaxID=244366 RepID=UPI001034D593|nr:transketolase [Klebsiella variicola]
MDHKQLANAIRILSIDAIQKANSGHPGAPMGMADVAEVVWRGHLRHNPANPGWFNRDRYVQSNGHGSMLQYSLLHLTGYDLTINDLKNFRQLHSRTPGHPEYGYTPGVETTTGPLGQGVANAVGMAIAEKTLAAQFNKPGREIVDHHTWLFLGDGCLMEGISHEACSLAGTLKLGKLIAVWDDNGISIDGHVDAWFSDDTPARFRAYGWHVIEDIDGHNAEAVNKAVTEARAVTDKPSLLCCKTIIGFGSPNKANSHDCHGSALGADEVALVRKELHWPYEPFVIPDEIYRAWDAKQTGAKVEAEWNEKFAAYARDYPELAKEFTRRMEGKLPQGWHEEVNAWIRDLQAHPASLATRQVSQKCLSYFARSLPELFGGSADLSPSNLTRHQLSVDFSDQNPSGNYLSYGVREFGMSAIMNGMALHGGLLPYGGTFLMFMEYARNAVRMAALMKAHSIFVYTHDSVGLGEDGPTHQPVEQLASLRLTPNMETWRGCDQVEAAIGWQQAIERSDGPSALIMTRQPLAQQPRSEQQLKDVRRGGYILLEPEGEPELIILSAGSEIELAVYAAGKLNREGRRVRVVSMPCTERFDQQEQAYKNAVLPQHLRKRLAVEASIEGFWQRYTGLDGEVIGMQTFGESAPATVLFEYFGFSKEHVLERAKALLAS